MPIALLGMAVSAFKAIEEGCEVYKQYKGTLVAEVKDVQKVVKDVQATVKEVKGFWAEVKNLFGFGGREANERPALAVQAEVKETARAQGKAKTKPKQEWQEFDETAATLTIVDNLAKFFNVLQQAQTQVKLDEETSRTVYDPDKNHLEAALRRVVALQQIRQMQGRIRTIMCWEAPAELEDLYTQVTKMAAVVGEEQELARLSEIKKRRDEVWLRLENAHRRQVRVIYAILVISGVLWLGWVLAEVRAIVTAHPRTLRSSWDWQQQSLYLHSRS